MKTSVSIPNQLYEKAERAARRLRMSRSELYAKALRAYLDTGRDEAVTEALNKVYLSKGSGLDEGLTRMQFASLVKNSG